MSSQPLLISILPYLTESEGTQATTLRYHVPVGKRELRDALDLRLCFTYPSFSR